MSGIRALPTPSTPHRKKHRENTLSRRITKRRAEIEWGKERRSREP
uniref:Uncharacterized protein n=1 Tax=Cucumis melo TaxID=3656 RepID=A0A9I9ECF2_CUCME